MTTAHTQGPWHFGTGDEQTPAGVGSRNRAPLCKMSGNDAEDVANARLIAAAPDLYYALKHMNHIPELSGSYYCICPCNDGTKPESAHATACNSARAAVAKAEGK